MSIHSRHYSLAILGTVLLCTATTSLGATITVTNTADSGNGSLRAALASAANGDTIDATGVSGTILLTSGELFVTTSVTIRGPGPGSLAVNGNFPNTTNRVFHIAPSNTVTISGLTISNGAATGTYPTNAGGGIFNERSILTVSNCAVTANSGDYGGGIYNAGSSGGSATLSVSASTFSSNSASIVGGAIYSDGEFGSATLSVSASSFSRNRATNGGGIYNDGYSGRAMLTVSASTFSSNSAPSSGGGIYNNGYSGGATSTVSNCNMSSNSAAFGGGIYNDGRSSGTGTVQIANCTLSGNSATSAGGGIYNAGDTGGSARLSATATIFNGNWATLSGGAIFNDGESSGTGTVQIASCTLSGNSAAFAGGIYNDGRTFGSATLTMTNSTFSGNSASSSGGGIYNDGGSSGTGVVQIAYCTLSGNAAAFGGGIYNNGKSSGRATLSMTNSTLSGNSASSDGGGIYNDALNGNATLRAVNSTLNGNSAGSGGGLFNYGVSGSATVQLGSTIFRSSSIGNASGAIASLGYNLSSDNGGGFLTATGDQINTDPNLGALQDNGGPTFTHAPLNGSPAIDKGANFSGSATDQRGAPRNFDYPDIPNAASGDGTDIGAVEVPPPAVFTVLNTDNSGPGSLRTAISNANARPSLDLIQFDSSVTGTITLTSGELFITDSLFLSGPGAIKVAINGNAASRVFRIASGLHVTIAGLTITNGFAPNDFAGGIYNDHSILTVSNCTLSGNSAFNAGGIYNGGFGGGSATLTVIASTLSGNSAAFGAGTLNDGRSSGSATLTITNSTFSGNMATNNGGGIYNAGSSGGSATVTLITSTLNGNLGFGGAIYNDRGSSGSATVGIGGTIFNVNGIVNNSGAITSLGYNLISTSGGSFLNAIGDQTNTDPMLGPLQLNGGQTPTHALLPNSPAIDAGKSFGVTNDQRSLLRPFDLASITNVSGGDGSDIGAVETQLTSPSITSAGSATFVTGMTNTFRIITAGFPAPVIWATGTLPPGVSLTDGGVLSGPPPVGSSGVYPFTVFASNGVPPVATQSFTLTVVECATLAARPSFNTNGLGWVLNGDSVNGGPNISNNVFTLTDGSSGENRSGWFGCPLYVGAFQASFTYQDIGGNGADGMAFVIQNDPRGSTALGAPGAGLGYSGITPSVAVLFNIYAGSPGGAGMLLGTNGVGAVNGRTYQSTAPVNVDAGNPIAVGLRYTGGILSVSLTDTVTSANFQTNIPVGIVGFLGTNAAWVGITGSEGGVLSHQIVSNFNYRPLPTLAITRSQAGSLVFTWPAIVYGFGLQFTTNLNNTAGWTSVAATVTQTNNLNQVTIPSPTSAQFFRLVLP